MIGVDDALRRVLEAAAGAGPLGVEEARLGDATGRVVRETIAADRDFPPFTRSAMDGYAVRAADTRQAPVVLEVVEEIPAGRQPARAVGAGQASRIMTGAPLPEGADAVQMVERTEPAGPGRTRVMQPVDAGEHVRRAGEDLRSGAVLVENGTRLGPAHVALMATAGRAAVSVSRRPRVAILPTGDELVPVESVPGASQIRESNGHTLAAMVARAGGSPELLPIARDLLDELIATIGTALERADVMLLSGGVSMGDFDLVGRALEALGCRPIFERVAIQPGKPLFFGRAGRLGRVLVFGLPGNPVSTVVDFLVFARPAIRRLMGESVWADPLVEARLAEPVSRRSGRRAYLPAVLSQRDGETMARLVPSMGSADMVALSRADALAIIPEDRDRLDAGATVRALPLSGLTLG